MSGAKAAVASGVSATVFNAYLRGDVVPGADVLARFADSTGCDPGWLLCGRGEPFPTLGIGDDDDSRDHVRAAWTATLQLLDAACTAQRELAPLIGSTDAGDPTALGHLADRLRGATLDLEELSRAARRPRRQAAGAE